MAKHLSAALALLGAASAQATPLTVSQTVTLSELLSGASTGISFNINSQLAAAGRDPAGILSADLVVFGYSDAQYNPAQAEPYSGYEVTGTSSRTVSVPYTYYYYSPGSCYYSWWGGSYCYSGYSYSYTSYYTYAVNDTTTVRSRDILHTDDVADTMVVSAGNTSATASASAHTTQADPYGALVYERTDGDYNNGWIYRYNRERDVYDAISGEIETVLHLDAAALADLGADGTIDALVGASAGSFRLTSASLTAVVDASVVPEPGTLGLMGLAVAGGIAARRRGRKK